MSDDFTCVFNAREVDVQYARKVILREFGAEAWQSIKARKRTGLMEIFQHPPDGPAERFVKIIADRVRKRLGW